MKVTLISIFCALAGHAAAGAIGWPGAVPLAATIIPGETRINAYSTSQYLNAIPASYSIGAHPQFAIQGAYANSFAPFPSGLYSIGNPSYIQPANIYYPSQAALVPGFGAASIVGASGFPTFPNVPSSPSGSAPTNPAFAIESSNNQPAQGDADSAVIDSAEFANQQRDQSLESSSSKPGDLAQPQPSPPESVFPQSPPNTFPQFPAIPQIPQENQGASVPQFPQIPTDYPQKQNPQLSQIPQTPNIPQVTEQPPNNFPGFPQIPQNPPDFAPNFPQFPQIPQAPPQPPSSFPGPGNNNAGLNDEDTIAVESA